MRILVVEDEPDLLRSLAQALREEGYAVDTADNGDDGLFSAEGTDYDAIVLDVMLPGMDGWEILKRLRKTKKTPVLMLTAREDVYKRQVLNSTKPRCSSSVNVAAPFITRSNLESKETCTSRNCSSARAILSDMISGEPKALAKSR